MSEPLRPGSRFRELFPTAARLLLHSGTAVAGTCAVAAVASAWSLHLSLAAVIAGTALIVISSERRFLDSLLLTPSAVLMRNTIAGAVIGVPLLAMADDWTTSSPLLAIQFASLYVLLCNGAAMHVLLARTPAPRMPRSSPEFRKSCLRPLAAVGWMSLGLNLGYLIVGILSGRLDRGAFGDDAAAQAFGYWTAFEIVPRFSNAGMFLAPVIWTAGTITARVLLVTCVVVTIAIGTATGSRGLVVMPTVSLVIGLYLFAPLRPLVMRSVIFVALASLAIIVPAALSFRDSDAFRSTPAADVGARLAIFARQFWAQEPAKQSDLGADRAREAGTQLIGVVDELVYAQTPGQIPYSGTDRLEAALTAWLPQYIVPNRRPLMDGNEIAAEYAGYTQERTFATISLEADLFRRWGVAGIAIGVPVAALLSAAAAAVIFRILLHRDAVLGFALLALGLSAFDRSPWSTVLWSAQQWSYDVPKHVAVAIAAAWLARRLTGAGASRGLTSYGRPDIASSGGQASAATPVAT